MSGASLPVGQCWTWSPRRKEEGWRRRPNCYLKNIIAPKFPSLIKSISTYRCKRLSQSQAGHIQRKLPLGKPSANCWNRKRAAGEESTCRAEEQGPETVEAGGSGNTSSNVPVGGQTHYFSISCPVKVSGVIVNEAQWITGIIWCVGTLVGGARLFRSTAFGRRVCCQPAQPGPWPGTHQLSELGPAPSSPSCIIPM